MQKELGKGGGNADKRRGNCGGNANKGGEKVGEMQ